MTGAPLALARCPAPGCPVRWPGPGPDRACAGHDGTGHDATARPARTHGG
jgi:hypothetical protein